MAEGAESRGVIEAGTTELLRMKRVTHKEWESANQDVKKKVSLDLIWRVR